MKGREKSPGRRSQAVAAKRTAIVNAALSLFSQYGLHGTRIEQVAALAAVSKTNLLYYFPSKEQLYLAVLQDILAIWLAPLRALHADQQPLQAINHYIRLKLEVSRDHPQASRLFCLEILQGAPVLHKELEGNLRELVDEKAALIRHWISAGQLAEVDPRQLIFMLWSVTQHYADFAVQIRSVTGKSLQDPQFFADTLQNIQTVIGRGLCPQQA
ncbi:MULTISPECIES: HTH-type transcriptional regulator RutR [Tatumella]|uniref:HTH-type transcriptional regulator RutR n=1 Tax=Tatumella punctata TaxID=399969 RepID=A0ABW1VJT5_9GAMM|nr:HTH-type transcriptional regulator RutR [Tatumella sp. JGM16]MBS0892753.1 HTH-type transcriptional regulator RutR [Tatumella sp. JGM130]MBS0912032.1 HTH-type transcriptional regulator RutR [Tatumella sp. JGM91]